MVLALALRITFELKVAFHPLAERQGVGFLRLFLGLRTRRRHALFERALRLDEQESRFRQGQDHAVLEHVQGPGYSRRGGRIVATEGQRLSPLADAVVVPQADGPDGAT